MPVSHAANSDTFKVRRRRIARSPSRASSMRPRELVFEAMTKPEHVRRWWGCLDDGYSVTVCEIDLRVGGAWRFVGRGPEGQYPAFYGVYREIDAPGRLVYTEIFEPFPDVESVVTQILTRGRRQDAPHGHRVLPVARGPGHGAQDRNGERRCDQLRPSRRRRAANCARIVTGESRNV